MVTPHIEWEKKSWPPLLEEEKNHDPPSKIVAPHANK